ncbi:hypothetical protein QE197_10925 [Arsenophonus nasoniae]|uniref:Uncharacterized protein n=2 Tax=Arsenophonus nasoniae TaxID=638 RepID=A0A4P7L247_9GAMM|nr:hypothetical protein [Arsenophonus nasoniae]QBY43978.1 hypothetical protein ArsFIN_25510 [Arsenophonus nasoniae]WGM04296.1 hypothetical protein QE258_11655 [Arsenophonus nasoniae]WGM09398.1 hypothetical protein QE197_10925 [Arsenophonus nasoniae]WGM14123.1 hypothetical protein QE193_10820 [Arsenophonus nasoniae]
MIKPTFEGFLDFVRNIMKVPESAISDDDPALKFCYDTALEFIPKYLGLEFLPHIYVTTVYNCAASFLINYAQDTPPDTYWSDIRKSLGIGTPSYGITNSAADQGTSGSIVISQALSNLSLADLMLMKDPYGRQVVAILMEMGPLWGLTK